jgi:hypothetical protein
LTSKTVNRQASIGQSFAQARRSTGRASVLEAGTFRRRITSQADDEWGSKNRIAFEEIKPGFDRWTLYDNSVDKRDQFWLNLPSLGDRARS